MTRLSREELEQLRADGLSEARRRDFRAAERAGEAWRRERSAGGGAGVEAVLDWIDQLREVFGEPEVDRRPWVGSDFRL